MIGSGIREHPHLPEPFPSNRKFWKCPKTGIVIPKRHDEHMAWRGKMLRQAHNDPILQKDLLAACKESLLFWVNGFAWTRHELETDPNTGKQYPAKEAHWPFNTWEIQDEAFDWIEERFNQGEDGLFDKSREMGASWLCLIFNHWLWLFRPDTEIREMSRIEDLVDSALTDSLFYKHDYLNNWIPSWMRPPGITVRGKNNRTHLRIYNELNNSTIAGAATSKHALRAGRCALLLLDEFAVAESAEQIRIATTSVTSCRIVNSTTVGAGTEYSRWKNSGQIKVFSGLKFWNHPQKGRGRFVLQDPITKRYEISSPYIEHKKTRSTTKELAQEEYGVDLQAGDTFFDLQNIETHIALFARPPIKQFSIGLKQGIADDGIFQLIRRRDTKAFFIREKKDGQLEVWTELINGRPDQSKTYIFGVDVSQGQGASESVISIRCRQTGEIIAKWKCRNTPPHEFARIIVAVSLWCGGSNPQRLPFLKWENNGPGWDLGRLLVKEFKYPYYYCSSSVGTVIDKTSDKYGFQTNRTSKELLLREYERMLLQGKVINHDARGLEQAKYYVYYPSGGIGPAELQDKKQVDMLLHGDIVMADALTADDRNIAKPKEEKINTPFRSWGHRFEAWKKSQEQSSWQKKYSFR